MPYNNNITAPMDQSLYYLDDSTEISAAFAENVMECHTTKETLQVRLASSSEITQNSENCIASETQHATEPVVLDNDAVKQPEREINVWLSCLRKYPMCLKNF